MQTFKLVKDVPQHGHTLTITVGSAHQRDAHLKAGWSLAPETGAAASASADAPVQEPAPVTDAPKKRGRQKKDA